MQGSRTSAKERHTISNTQLRTTSPTRCDVLDCIWKMQKGEVGNLELSRIFTTKGGVAELIVVLMRRRIEDVLLQEMVLKFLFVKLCQITP